MMFISVLSLSGVVFTSGFFKILSELFMMLLIILLSAQSASLWSSLIIVPLSIAVIFMSSSTNVFSGLFIFLFVMVFIGGLLVLLLSVASISYQEQSFSFIKMWVLFALMLLLPVFIMYKTPFFNVVFITGVSWFYYQSVLLTLSLTVLLISLVTMSKLILSFKGLIRSI